jgi:hypothetical protein
LALILALVAGQAGAQSNANPNANPGLRGLQSATGGALAAGAAPRLANGQSPAPVEPPTLPSLAPPPPLMSLLPPPPDQPLCRTTCARSYYFCLSVGDAAEDCGGTWAQCAARCNRSPS